MAAPTRCSVKIVKSMSYRGNTKLWSNRYFFTGPTTLNTTTFNNIADWLETQEKGCLPAAVTWVEAVGYNAGSEIPAFSKSLSGTGSQSTTGGQYCPGDCAAIVKYDTDTRTSKNHPIYLFKYYHVPLWQTSANADTLLPAQKADLESMAAALVTGFSDGTNTRVLCGPRGAVAQARTVSPLITHRDFLR